METVGRWILAIGSILCVIIGIGCGSSSKPLGEYKSSLSDLFPEKAGDFKREKTRPFPLEGNKEAEQMGMKESFQALYTSDQTSIDIRAFNFSSEQKAKDAMRKMAREPINRDIKEETKDLGNRVQGLTGPEGRDSLFVIWNNGTVVFTLDSADFNPGGRAGGPRDEPNISSDERDKLLLKFERDFPYSITNGESFQIQPRRAPATNSSSNSSGTRNGVVETNANTR